jgi:hypothetical protein
VLAATPSGSVLHPVGERGLFPVIIPCTRGGTGKRFGVLILPPREEPLKVHRMVGYHMGRVGWKSEIFFSPGECWVLLGDVLGNWEESSTAVIHGSESEHDVRRWVTSRDGREGLVWSGAPETRDGVVWVMDAHRGTGSEGWGIGSVCHSQGVVGGWLGEVGAVLSKSLGPLYCLREKISRGSAGWSGTTW